MSVVDTLFGNYMVYEQIKEKQPKVENKGEAKKIIQELTDKYGQTKSS